MSSSSAAQTYSPLFTDFPKGTMPLDERTRRESSEADPHIKRIETENRDWLVHYIDAYSDSNDADSEKIEKTSMNFEINRSSRQPIINFPHFKEWRKGHFVSLKKWEGIVESVFESSFVARIKDVANEVPDERVEIDFDELTNIDEKKMIEVGAIFSWTMGYHVSSGGTRKRQAILIFRRMPKWTEEDIQRGYKVADEMFAKLG